MVKVKDIFFVKNSLCLFIFSYAPLVLAGFQPRSGDSSNKNNFDNLINNLNYSEKKCVDFINIQVPKYKKLKKYLNPRDTIHPVIDEVLSLGKTRCFWPEKVIELIDSIYQPKMANVGVFLPRFGKNHLKSLNIELGLKSVSEKINKKLITFSYHDSDPKKIKKTLAKLVFQNKLSLIIGGITAESAAVLAKVSKELKVPLILFNRNFQHKSRQTIFQALPEKRDIINYLLLQVKNSGIDSLVLVIPNTSRDDEISLIEEIAPQIGVNVLAKQTFTPNNYNSLLRASKIVENLANNRKGHLAVFIPGHYDLAFQFAKILSYLSVTKVKILGTHLWRVKGLMDRWEPALDGAAFIDLIGDYKNLPKNIFGRVADHSYLTYGSELGGIDLRYSGYKVGKVVKNIIFNSKRNKKSILRTMLDLPQLKNGKVHWPPYLFELRKRNLVLKE